jgi:hypothetical protein
MGKTQKDPNIKPKDPHGLMKLGLIIAAFIGLMILLKYILDAMQK